MKIKLDHLKLTDFELFKEFLFDVNVSKYLTRDSYSKKSRAFDYFSKAINKKKFPDEMLGVYLDNKIIGSVHLIYRGDYCMQFGFGIKTKFWNKGIGSNIVALSLYYIKNNWGNKVYKILADIHEDNIYAIRIVLKNGFILNKYKLELAKCGKKFRNRYVYYLNNMR